MKENKLLKNIFTADILFNDTVSYRRVIVINSVLLLAMFAFTLFTLLHIFISKNYYIALLDLLSLTMSLVAFLHLRKKKNIPQTAFIVTLNIMIFISIFTISNENSNFGIIWAIFPPFFAMLINEKKVGLLLIIPFYTLMYYLAYINIGIWNGGLWEMLDFYRFVIATLLLTGISYTAESSYDMSDRELALVRKNEAKVMKELQEQAITDSLTSMYNRRYFNHIVPKIIKHAQRNQNYLSFFILDIDYFKNYNDTYGHQAGDMVLQKVAKALISFIKRDDDFVFRIGGEEFAGILHVNNVEESKEWLSQLNREIYNLNIEHKETLLKDKILTVSIGVSTKKVSAQQSLNDFYKDADNALYKAKESGRNRLVVNV